MNNDLYLAAGVAAASVISYFFAAGMAKDEVNHRRAMAIGHALALLTLGVVVLIAANVVHGFVEGLKSFEQQVNTDTFTP